MKIDAHHHFWQYDPVEYSWMNEQMGILKENYGPEDLLKQIQKVGIDGVVSVQASQSLKETDKLLSHAEVHNFIKGVVGWFPLADSNVESVLNRYSSNPLLKGVRHVVQDEPDDRFIMGADFNRGVSLLKELNLVYDILIFEKQLAASIEFVDLHPDLVFVLDHVAKPRIKDALFEPWASQMKDLSKRENVFCKLSGMATEANWQDWSVDDLQPYMETALECFGPERMMFGSDWPVARLAVEYENWVKICRNFISTLSTDEQIMIEGKNAIEIYKL
jgi:L-fuconolactonase